MQRQSITLVITQDQPYAVFAMLSIIVGLSISGIMIGQGADIFEEVHEFLTYAMFGVVFVHILGVTLYSIRTKENITAGMIHGKKHGRPADAISSPRPIAAIIFVIIVGAWSWELISHYDASSQTTRIPILGLQLKPGEQGENDKKEHSEKHDRED